MGRRLVEQENGKLACFSSIPDQFIAYEMTDDEAIEFFAQEAAERAREMARSMIREAREGGQARTKATLREVRDTPSAAEWRKRFAAKPSKVAK